MNSQQSNCRPWTGLQCWNLRKLRRAFSRVPPNPHAQQGPMYLVTKSDWPSINTTDIINSWNFNKIFLIPLDIGISSYLGQSALICGYHRLGYSIFTDPNDKFINVDVRAFVKSDAKEPHFGKSSYRLKKFYATISLIQMLLVLAHQIVSA